MQKALGGQQLLGQSVCGLSMQPGSASIYWEPAPYQSKATPCCRIFFDYANGPMLDAALRMQLSNHLAAAGAALAILTRLGMT